MSIRQLTVNFSSVLRSVLVDYGVLVKMRLSILVVFSSFIGYLLGTESFSLHIASAVIVGGLLITFAANSMNQVLEKDFDRLMERTRLRPVVTGRILVPEAVLFSGLSCLAGTLALATVNMWAALFGMLSFVLYAFVYTPLKRIHPIAVLVGAIPGAMPAFIGWISGAGSLGPEGLLLFSLQFFWQFPHFWAIAWLGHKDYYKAGFRLLPEHGGIPSRQTAIQSMIYAACLLVLPFLFFYGGYTGVAGLLLLLALGLHYTWKAWVLVKRLDDVSARQLLFASFLYLPAALLSLWIENLVMS